MQSEKLKCRIILQVEDNYPKLYNKGALYEGEGRCTRMGHKLVNLVIPDLEIPV